MALTPDEICLLYTSDVKDIKENCIRREEFVSHQLKLENKLDRLMEFMMKQGGN